MSAFAGLVANLIVWGGAFVFVLGGVCAFCAVSYWLLCKIGNYFTDGKTVVLVLWEIHQRKKRQPNPEEAH